MLKLVLLEQQRSTRQKVYYIYITIYSLVEK